MLSMESTLLYMVYCICTLPVPSFHLCNISPADMAFAMIFSEVCLQCVLNWHTRPPRLYRGVVCVRPSGASLFFPISFHYHAFYGGGTALRALLCQLWRFAPSEIIQFSSVQFGHWLEVIVYIQFYYLRWGVAIYFTVLFRGVLMP